MGLTQSGHAYPPENKAFHGRGRIDGEAQRRDDFAGGSALQVPEHGQPGPGMGIGRFPGKRVQGGFLAAYHGGGPQVDGQPGIHDHEVRDEPGQMDMPAGQPCPVQALDLLPHPDQGFLGNRRPLLHPPFEHHPRPAFLGRHEPEGRTGPPGQENRCQDKDLDSSRELNLRHLENCRRQWGAFVDRKSTRPSSSTAQVRIPVA